MALWNSNDKEHAKPSWLTEEQKRLCFRTNRGWEIPLAGFAGISGAENLGGSTANGATSTPWLYRAAGLPFPTELLVALPFDASPTGVTNSALAGGVFGERRGASAWDRWGKTGGAFRVDSLGVTGVTFDPNYTPYFTWMFGGPTGNAPVNTGTITLTRGVTAYIPLIAADANVIDLHRNFIFTITGTTGSSAGVRWSALGANGVGLTFGDVPTGFFDQPTTLTGGAATGNYDRASNAALPLNPWGGLGGFTQGLCVLAIGVTALGPTGPFGFTATVNDGHTGPGGAPSLTGTLGFSVLFV